MPWYDSLPRRRSGVLQTKSSWRPVIEARLKGDSDTNYSELGRELGVSESLVRSVRDDIGQPKRRDNRTRRSKWAG